jgi:hypothetical protein
LHRRPSARAAFGTLLALTAARNAGGTAMLRITAADENSPNPLVKLEGKLVGPWVDEARRACGGGAGLRLDLSALTFVDAAGARLLRELLQGGAAVGPCSGFVAALLEREMP